MVNQDIIIANNIIKALNAMNTKQSQLAESLNMPRQTVHKMLNGTRIINASELKKIATFLDTTMENLCEISDSDLETNVLRVFVDKVEDEEAKQTILLADELINMLLFHRDAATKYENNKKVEPLNE